MEIKKDGSSNTLIALLAAGKENCCLVMPEVKEIIRPVRPERHVQESLFTMDGESAEAAREAEELKRQQEKEAIIAKQRAEKEAQKAAEEAQKAAEEAEKQKKADCEELIQEAVRLKNNEKYSDALKKLKKAASMNIAGKAEAIKTIKNEIEELKSKNSFASRIGNWINTILDENN
jgi:cell division protein FtsA